MTGAKLNNEQRMIALRMFAEGLSTAAIAKEIKQQFNITISANSILATCNAKKHQPYVKDFRDSYLAKVKSVPIANKRIRIDDFEVERKRLKKLIEESPKKSRADKSLYLSLVSELRRINVEAREEMEKKPHLFQNVVVGMGDMSDEALHKRKQDIIRKLRGSFRGRASGTSTTPAGADSEDAGEPA